MRHFKIISVVLFSVFVFGSLFLINGCAEKEPETIKIGAILPLTGPAASLGEWFRNGYEVAAEEINGKTGSKGRKIKLFIQDGVGDPKTSIFAFNHLLASENIKIATTTLSGPSLALIPISEEHGIIMFANAAHPQITANRKYVLRHSNTAEQEARKMARYIINELKPKNLSIAFINDDFGLAFKDEFLKNIQHQPMVKILNVIPFDKTENSFRSHSVKLTSPQPDGIVVIGFAKNMGLLIKRIRELRFKGFLFANLGFTLPDVQYLAGDAAKGVFYIDFDFDRDDSRFTDINGKFRLKFKRDISSVEILAVNTLYLLNDAVENVGFCNERIIKYIKGKTHFRGVGENLTILQNGDILPQLKVVQK